LTNRFGISNRPSRTGMVFGSFLQL